MSLNKMVLNVSSETAVPNKMVFLSTHKFSMKHIFAKCVLFVAPSKMSCHKKTFFKYVNNRH